MNFTFDIPGKPHPKARPRFNRKSGHMWTPSSAHEDDVVKFLLSHSHRTKLQGMKRLSVSMWFYGADSRADLDNLGKLIMDALVKARVLDDDRIPVVIRLMCEAAAVQAMNNPFKGEPGTRVLIGEWE